MKVRKDNSIQILGRIPGFKTKSKHEENIIHDAYERVFDIAFNEETRNAYSNVVDERPYIERLERKLGHGTTWNMVAKTAAERLDYSPEPWYCEQAVICYWDDCE